MNYSETGYLTLHKLVPEGQYQAVIDDVAQCYASPDEEIDYHELKITWILDDEMVSDTPKIVQSIILDVTSDNDNDIDMSKGANIELKNLFIDLEQFDHDWVLSKLIGTVALIRVSHKAVSMLLCDEVIEVRAI